MFIAYGPLLIFVIALNPFSGLGGASIFGFAVGFFISFIFELLLTYVTVVSLGDMSLIAEPLPLPNYLSVLYILAFLKLFNPC